MCLAWLTCSLNSTLISFLLKYFPGNIFLNGLISCMAELAGSVISGFALMKWNTKICLKTSFLIATTGGILMIYFLSQPTHGKFTSDEMVLFGAFILIIKLGNSAAYGVLYC